MSKCLVTKLKAVVDNPGLPIFGELEIMVKVFDSPDALLASGRKYYLIGAEPLVATVPAPYQFADENNTPIGNTITGTTINIGFLYIDDNTKGNTVPVKIRSKYNLVSLLPQDFNNVVMIKTEDLRYCSKLSEVASYNNGRLVGDLMDLKNLPLNRLCFGNCDINGSLEEFAEYRWRNGLYSNIILINAWWDNVTFNGQTNNAQNYESTNRMIISEDGISITIRLSSGEKPTYKGTFDGSTWTYEGFN